MASQRSRSRRNSDDTPLVTDEQVMEMLGRVAPGVKALGPVERLGSSGQRQIVSVPVMVDEAQLKVRSRREGRKVLARLSSVERRLLARTELSRGDRRRLAATIRDVRITVTPLLVGFE